MCADVCLIYVNKWSFNIETSNVYIFIAISDEILSKRKWNSVYALSHSHAFVATGVQMISVDCIDIL